MIASTYIVNRDGTSMVIGAGAYVKCYIENQELTSEYQGSSQYRIKIHSNVVLPIQVGARVFPQETNGAGGYVMLAVPAVEMVTSEHFVYDLVFCGFSAQLETVILFNQDAVGWGWETAFSLVGTGQDFIDLILRNMNRTTPTDSNLELWQAGTVDATGTTLISFDGDNCLTALKKVSEAFGLPYQVEGAGGFHEYWVNIGLTAIKRKHIHIYDMGSGLSKIRIQRDSDRKFATALCPLGSSKNIPYDYRGGLKRLHCGNPSPITVGTTYDENVGTEWTLYEITKDPTTTIDPDCLTNPAHGVKSLEIANRVGNGIDGTKIGFYTATDQDLSGTMLKMWVGSEEGFIGGYTKNFTISLYWEDHLLGQYTVIESNWLLWQLQDSPYWKEISIPTSVFNCDLNHIDEIRIEVGRWLLANDSVLKFDFIRFEGGGVQMLENFIFGTTYTDAYGKMELVLINEDIFPQLNGKITSLPDGTTSQFIDSAIPFDLNAKDGDGNSLYLIPDVTPKVNFTSGNLSGYSLAINWYKDGEKKIDLVPYTEESGNIIPSIDNLAYCLQVGDEYNITEILLPQEYIDDAESRLYVWALAEYAKYTALNEIAEIEIDHVWLYDEADPSELMYCTTDDPTPLMYYLADGFFKAGDLIQITVAGFYSRELLVRTVSQERAQAQETTYKLTLGNNEPMNITGKMLMSIRQINTQLAKQEEKLAKYFHK